MVRSNAFGYGLNCGMRPRDIIVEVALIGVQIQLLAHHDGEQTIVDEHTDAAKNRTTGNSPERRELFCDVTGQARLDPHIELLTLPDCFQAAQSLHREPLL